MGDGSKKQIDPKERAISERGLRTDMPEPGPEDTLLARVRARGTTSKRPIFSPNVRDLPSGSGHEFIVRSPGAPTYWAKRLPPPKPSKVITEWRPPSLKLEVGKGTLRSEAEDKSIPIDVPRFVERPQLTLFARFIDPAETREDVIKYRTTGWHLVATFTSRARDDAPVSHESTVLEYGAWVALETREDLSLTGWTKGELENRIRPITNMIAPLWITHSNYRKVYRIIRYLMQHPIELSLSQEDPASELRAHLQGM